MAIKWKVDPMHSELQFQVRHLMISKVTGNFNSFDLEVETETEDFNTAKSILLTANIDSISTNNEQRDAHLKSADFFNMEEHATLNFVGNKFGNFENIQGDLTIKGVTNPVKLNVEFGGIVTDPYGQTKAGLTVTGTIKRKDFGLTWDAVTEAGKIVLSDDIKINAEIQLTKLN